VHVFTKKSESVSPQKPGDPEGPLGEREGGWGRGRGEEAFERDVQSIARDRFFSFSAASPRFFRIPFFPSCMDWSGR